MANDLGFKLTGHSLHLYGHCNRPECQAKAEGK